MTHDIAQESEDRGGASTLLILLVALLVVGLSWLGVVSVLGTNHPLQATVGTSMLPTLETGDLVVLRGVAPQEIRVGDIVAVRPSPEDRAEYNFPAIVMHRVERISFDQGTVTVHTKGDNASAPDPFSVPASAVEGRLVYSIPDAGWVLFYLRSRQGLIAVGGLLLLYLVYAATKWVGDAAEELYEPETATATGFSELAFAMTEYGEHLRSHTRVVQELGGTTAELHSAAVTQNAVLDDLRGVLIAARSSPTLYIGTAGAPPLTTAAERSTVERPARPGTRMIPGFSGAPKDLEEIRRGPSVQPTPSISPRTIYTYTPGVQSPNNVPGRLRWRDGTLTLQVPQILDGPRLIRLGIAIEELPGVDAVSFERNARQSYFRIEAENLVMTAARLERVPGLTLVAESTSDDRRGG